MRLMMKGHPMSPLYWKSVHNALVDLVKQIGFPDLYWTLAPFEWSYPYHKAILDEMQKQLKSKTYLPVGETLHLAHTMSEIVRGYITGANDKSKQSGWTKHMLSSKDGSGRETVVNFFIRMEFQDGSRKEGTQQYHGSGRPHLHVLIWLDNKDSIGLENVISATMPGADKPELAAYVSGSQLDDKGDSRWPVHEGPSGYDADEELLRLHHTEDDEDMGLRGYFPAIMEALRCHQDLQISDGKALLLKYVSKYVAKWSDSSYDEWMNEEEACPSLSGYL